MNKYNELFQKLVPGLVRIYQDSSIQIVLYGSAARGTDTEESDLDIAIITPPCSKKTHDRMIDFVVDLELEYDKVLSVITIDPEEFSNWEAVLPFYKNLKREGIILWPAA